MFPSHPFLRSSNPIQSTRHLGLMLNLALSKNRTSSGCVKCVVHNSLWGYILYACLDLLGQWLNFKLFGITYLVGKIKFELFISGSIGWVSGSVLCIWRSKPNQKNSSVGRNTSLSGNLCMISMIHKVSTREELQIWSFTKTCCRQLLFQEENCWKSASFGWNLVISQLDSTVVSLLGGGNSNIFYFHPETLGRWSQLTVAYFSDGLVQPPTTRMSRWKLGSMVSKWVITYF